MGIGYQLLHSDAFTAELEALGLDSTLFGAAGIPAPIFQALVPRRAGAFDVNAHTFGTINEPAAFTRASEGLYRGPDGAWAIALDDEVRPDHQSDGSFVGYCLEPEATNLFLNSDAPVTQTIALSTGEHIISVQGTGSVLSSNNSGTATGHGSATDGSPVIIDVTGAGTFDFTVTGSPDYVQVELGSADTSPIVTAAASVTRAVDALIWNAAPDGFNAAAGMLAVDIYVDWDASFNAPSSNWGLVTLNNSALSQLYIGGAALFKTFDGVNGVQLAITRRPEQHRIVVRWNAASSELEIVGYNPVDGWRTVLGTYAGSWSSGGTIDRVQVFRSGVGPVRLKNLALWNRDIGSAMIQKLLTP